MVYLGVTLACMLWTFYAGQDASWDFMHYHVYAGFSALHDRFGQDFMAAGPQSYFNPYAYIPAYWLTQTALAPVVAGGLLAAAQSVIGWLAFEMGLLLQRDLHRPVRWAPVLCGTVLAMMSPILLAQLGTGYADISTGALVLGGVVACLRATQAGAARWDAVAGALIGIATALKLSNAIFGIAVGVALIFTAGAARLAARRTLAYATAGIAAWVAVCLPWSLRLWDHFGNPLFPFLNAWFQSDAYAAGTSGRHLRFIPVDWTDALLRPLRMALPNAGIYVEPPLPDLRYAALFVAGLVAGAARAWSRRQRSVVSVAECRRAANPFIAAWWIFLVAWALWLWTSGNGRYLAPMTVAVGPLLAETWYRAVSGRAKAFWYGMVLVIALQAGGLVLGSKLRWASGPWADHWIKVTVPQRVVNEPYLYLGTDMVSASVLAPYVNPRSGIVHVSGQAPLDLVGPGSRELRALMQRYRGRIRAVAMGTTPPQGTHVGNIVADLEQRIARLGLEVDSRDCLTVQVETAAGAPVEKTSASRDKSDPRPPAYLTACLTRPAPGKRELYLQQTQQVNRVFDQLERRCPELFHPPDAVTEYGGKGVWWRFYASTDVRLGLFGDDVRYLDTYRLGPAITLGPIKTWLSGKGRISCKLRYVPVQVTYTAKAASQPASVASR